MPDITSIFSVAEARAFDKGQLVNVDTYPNATIEAAEAAIRAEFERDIGVALVPTSRVEYQDGKGVAELRLRHHNPFSEVNPRGITVTACVIYNVNGSISETFDADDLADLACYHDGLIVRRTRGVFLVGRRNVAVTYTTGFTTVQADIRDAALTELQRRLIPTSVPKAAEGGTEFGVNWSRVRDPARGRWFGLPDVDAVINTYRAREHVPPVG